MLILQIRMISPANRLSSSSSILRFGTGLGASISRLGGDIGLDRVVIKSSIHKFFLSNLSLLD